MVITATAASVQLRTEPDTRKKLSFITSRNSERHPLPSASQKRANAKAPAPSENFLTLKAILIAIWLKQLKKGIESTKLK